MKWNECLEWNRMSAGNGTEQAHRKIQKLVNILLQLLTIDQ